MRDVDSGQDLTFYVLVLSIVYSFYSYENNKPKGVMEDDTWNKAYCFVYITCTMGQFIFEKYSKWPLEKEYAKKLEKKIIFGWCVLYQ
jgi:amino acid transporter